MNFAKQQLEKYGWSEGKGLGKNESGISTALKPKLKFDTTGLGHNASEQFTFNWWENVYKQASNNIQVNKEDGNVSMKVEKEDAVTLSTKEYAFTNLTKPKSESSSSPYGSFVKSNRGNCDEEEEENVSMGMGKAEKLTDEELFAICGGRTAHKGARHGLKLSGKLARLEMQEELLTKGLESISLQKTNVKEVPSEEKTKKEKKKKRNKDSIDMRLHKIDKTSWEQKKSPKEIVKFRQEEKKLLKKMKDLKEVQKMKVVEAVAKEIPEKKKKKKKTKLEKMDQLLADEKEKKNVWTKKKKKKGATAIFLENLGIVNEKKIKDRNKVEIVTTFDVSKEISSCSFSEKTATSKRKIETNPEDKRKSDLHRVQKKIEKRQKKSLKNKKKKLFLKTEKTVQILENLSIS